jgi:hypothetical protein
VQRGEIERVAGLLRPHLQGDDIVLRRQAAFSLLVLAWVAAEVDDAALARAMLAGVAEAVPPLGQPLITQMLVVAQARLAITEDRPADAVALVTRLLDGTDLLLARITHAEALAADGRQPEADAAFEWLRTHRGRAWAEFNSSAMLRPLNVAWTQLAMLRRVELDQGGAPTLDEFLAAWPRESLPPSIADRVARLARREAP